METPINTTEQNVTTTPGQNAPDAPAKLERPQDGNALRRDDLVVEVEIKLTGHQDVIVHIPKTRFLLPRGERPEFAPSALVAGKDFLALVVRQFEMDWNSHCAELRQGSSAKREVAFDEIADRPPSSNVSFGPPSSVDDDQTF